MQNKKNSSNSHEFAFYYAGLSDILGQDIDITITCDELYHRLKHVVRIKTDDRSILFNQKERVTFIFARFEGKNKIRGTWQNRQNNIPLKPHITFILPLLKIDALSDAIYSCAEVGITFIQLVTTTKTQTQNTHRLVDKLQRVTIAAAEQSKMYAFPTILAPVELDTYLMSCHNKPGLKFHFDITGIPFSAWHKPIETDQNYYLLVGPEGDLTDQEKLCAKNAGFITCLLTTTILRSIRTISLITGIFRL